MHNHLELKIWQRSLDLSIRIYRATEDFPNDERFALIQQIRRCSVSVPSNIAEGCGRNTNAQFAYHLNVSMGSLYELETQLIISNKLGYIDASQFDTLLDESRQIQKMIRVFTSSLK